MTSTNTPKKSEELKPEDAKKVTGGVSSLTSPTTPTIPTSPTSPISQPLKGPA